MGLSFVLRGQAHRGPGASSRKPRLQEKGGNQSEHVPNFELHGLRTRLSKCKHALRGASDVIINGNTKLCLHFRATVTAQGGHLAQQQRTSCSKYFPVVDARVTRATLRKRGLAHCQTRLDAEPTGHGVLTGLLLDSGSDRIRPRLYHSAPNT